MALEPSKQPKRAANQSTTEYEDSSRLADSWVSIASPKFISQNIQERAAVSNDPAGRWNGRIASGGPRAVQPGMQAQKRSFKIQGNLDAMFRG